MKLSKIPGLGRFGIYVDDLKIEDLNKMGESSYQVLIKDY